MSITKVSRNPHPKYLISYKIDASFLMLSMKVYFETQFGIRSVSIRASVSVTLFKLTLVTNIHATLVWPI